METANRTVAEADSPKTGGRAADIAVRLFAGVVTLLLWQIGGSVLYEFGTADLRPDYDFGPNQALCLLGASALCLLGASALSVVTAAMPYRGRKWVVPGLAMLVVPLVAMATTAVTSLVVSSFASESAGTAENVGSWAAHFLGALFCLVPVTVYAVAAVVRRAGIRVLTGVRVLIAVSLCVPVAALLSLIFGHGITLER